MRKDMFKVIVERPRLGPRYKMKRKKFHGEDDLPSQMSPQWHREWNGSASKMLNENLAPLKRYLGKQVGRPWSKTYSEICEHLHPSHTVKQHVRDHIEDFVVTKVAIGRHGEWINGNSKSNWGGRYIPWGHDFYVDPSDGILKDSRRLWKKLGVDRRQWWQTCGNHPDENVHVLCPNKEFHRINGLWFEITFDEQPEAPWDRLAFDALLKNYVSVRNRYALRKRQLSKAVLEKHGLKNGY